MSINLWTATPIRISKSKTGDITSLISPNIVDKSGSPKVWNNVFYTLPTAIDLKSNWETLDSASTGRDNNTGNMFRDKVADKGKWEITLPAGLSNYSVLPTQIDNNKDMLTQLIHYKPADWDSNSNYKNYYVYDSSTKKYKENTISQWNNTKYIYRAIPYYLLTGIPQILKIVSGADFYAYLPDTLTGTWAKKHVYCSSCEPQIDRITKVNWDGSPAEWLYKEISLHFIEM